MLLLVVNEADRQWEAQLALLRLVELAAIKAGANDVQLGLGESPLHAQHKAVVELGRIVTAVLVDHERIGDGAEFEQTMPVLVGARQPGSLEGEDRADTAHRHIADQRFEVLAVRCPRSGLAKVSIENPDLLRAPSERLRFARQIVLAFGALLIEANLGRR